MKNKTILKILFLSMVLSSCGLIERFKTPEQPTDSKDSTETTHDDLMTSSPASTSGNETDDLFAKTMEETSTTSASSGSDAPGNISSDPDLNSLEEEFSSTGDSKIRESNIAVTPVTKQPSQEAPVLVEEALPEIKTEIETPVYSEAGQIKSYRVQRGETLMQISFKLYGDISKWKDIKAMNSGKLSNNASLKTNTELKYRAPATKFVWNPAGTAYLIKNADTLGTISNSVYGTKKKWKSIWENNKPLIKNPNVIYAGFTLYYTNGGMANFVQPKAEQPTKEIVARELAKVEASREGIVEEVLIDDEIKAGPNHSGTNEIITDNEEEQMDEAIQTLSAPARKDALIKSAVEKVQRMPAEKEIDLINNISVPHDQEMSPDIDEEVQTL